MQQSDLAHAHHLRWHEGPRPPCHRAGRASCTMTWRTRTFEHASQKKSEASMLQSQGHRIEEIRYWSEIAKLSNLRFFRRERVSSASARRMTDKQQGPTSDPCRYPLSNPGAPPTHPPEINPNCGTQIIFNMSREMATSRGSGLSQSQRDARVSHDNNSRVFSSGMRRAGPLVAEEGEPPPRPLVAEVSSEGEPAPRIPGGVPSME